MALIGFPSCVFSYYRPPLTGFRSPPPRTWSFPSFEVDRTCLRSLSPSPPPMGMFTLRAPLCAGSTGAAGNAPALYDASDMVLRGGSLAVPPCALCFPAFLLAGKGFFFSSLLPRLPSAFPPRRHVFGEVWYPHPAVEENCDPALSGERSPLALPPAPPPPPTSPGSPLFVRLLRYPPAFHPAL